MPGEMVKVPAVNSWTTSSTSYGGKLGQIAIETCIKNMKPGKVLNRNIPIDVDVTVGPESVVQETEAQTIWVNRLLEKVELRPIADLKKSIADGLFLPQLLEIITCEKITEIQARPIKRAQKVENLHKCLVFLKQRKVDLQNVSAEDLADGNLQATINLLYNVRMVYDPMYNATQHHRDYAPSHDPPPYQEAVQRLAKINGNVNATKRLEQLLGEEQMLPPNEDRSSPDSGMESTPKSGNSENLIPGTVPNHDKMDPGKNFNELNAVKGGRTHNNLDDERFDEPTKMPGRSDPIETRLQYLFNHHNHMALQRAEQKIANGEWVVPPQNTSRPENYMLYYDHGSSDLYEDQTYEPSHPQQRPHGPRGEKLLDRRMASPVRICGNNNNAPRSRSPHQCISNEDYTMNSDACTCGTGSTYARVTVDQHPTRGTNDYETVQNSELRAACSRLYSVPDRKYKDGYYPKTSSLMDQSRSSDELPLPLANGEAEPGYSQCFPQRNTTQVPAHRRESRRDASGNAVHITIAGKPPATGTSSETQYQSTSNRNNLFNNTNSNANAHISGKYNSDAKISNYAYNGIGRDTYTSNVVVNGGLQQHRIYDKIRNTQHTNVQNTYRRSRSVDKDDRHDRHPRRRANSAGSDSQESSLTPPLPASCEESDTTSILSADSVLISIPGINKLGKRATPDLLRERKEKPDGDKHLKYKLEKGKVKKKKKRRRRSLSLDSASPGVEHLTLDYSSDTETATASRSDESSDVEALRKQIQGMELMYTELLKSLGVKSELLEKAGRHHSANERTKGSRSIVMQDQRAKDIKAVNKRFSRLESHVVTLARSVAHLSSEMRSQNLMFQEVENMKREIHDLRVSRLPDIPRSRHQEMERFRQILPGLTNPYRINKLSKFFGENPPLLELFLKKLGYERYIPNFVLENISMVELPYLNEERLEKMKIPLGPRTRILQEAQRAFRDENIQDIYLV